MKIIQLPDALANKIAAGEVVERPAAVVKELIENSIDANSTSIKLDIKEAGMMQIKITDNGDGMEAADCERAFLRHATSKIKFETDLFHVRTLGFRGEALASIAAVSKLTIKTSLGEEAGTLLRMEGGKIVERGKSDARKGSEITVDHLFFNTPARLKYMRTIYTELGHITDLLNRLALAHPEIRFEATHNGKPLFKTPGNKNMLQVVSEIYGMNVARNMFEIKANSLDFELFGYIAKPEITRASNNYISLIINGRYIRNYAVNKAILRAYHTLLPLGRSPIVVLHIKMDPILVDVNVHPTKLEVRFSKEKELITFVEEAIQAIFRKTTLIPEIEKKEKYIQRSVQPKLQFDMHEKEENFQEKLPWQKVRETPIYIPLESPEDPDPEITASNFTEPAPNPFERIETAVAENTKALEVEAPEKRIPRFYPIGQLQGTYILAQNEEGLYMIDQHAAQERIKYEYFKQKLGEPTNELQQLLLPLTFDFSKQEAIFIEEYNEALEKVGIFFEQFGNLSYVIRSYPNWFPAGEAEAIIREMVEQIIKEQKINVESIREEAAIMMSCKGSIKANHYLTEADMNRLVEDLQKTKDPFTCPHGRPVIVHITTYELEKMFKRVM